MAPAIFDQEEAHELQKLGVQIKEFQDSRKMPFSQLLKRFPGIGSDRTFSKIVRGEVGDLDLEKQFRNYKTVIKFIEAQGAGEPDEVIYEDLWPAAELLRVFGETMNEAGNGRGIFLIGPSGSGKSCARSILTDEFPARFVVVEASAAWNGSPMAFLGSLLTALGERTMPYSQFDRLEKVIERLNDGRIDVIVEEAHHLMRANLNIEVTLINRTPSIFINVAIDTLWKKLASEAFEECRQLTGNRLAEVIKLTKEVNQGDVEIMLERRVKLREEDRVRAVHLVLAKAANNGRLAFVRDVCKRVNALAKGKAVTLELITTAVEEEVKSR